ncbi:S8 family peptidase [Mucilaginibacter gynuensis]|uniref:S8 family peptidase n=1 Tax=Mucilaginibacter gynuensis TaxID=1302236 RepID=A0ABP8H913_9SPHI
MIVYNLMKKACLIAGLSLPLFTYAQKADKPKENWQNLDLKADGVFGISTERAYNELLKNKKHVPVLVGVIDGGVDINHEDLKQVLWTNPGEIAGNKTDDDKNGFADDVHGWCFIGSPAKGNIQYDNMELVRLLRQQKDKYENLDSTAVKPEDADGYKNYRAMKKEVEVQTTKYQKRLAFINRFSELLYGIMGQMKKDNPTAQDFKDFTADSDAEAYIRKTMIDALGEMDYATFKKDEITGPAQRAGEQLNYHLNFNFDPRDTVGDNYANSSEHFYGNSDVTGPHNEHGTHVAGIIAAARDNNIGIKGVANDARIMVVQVVPTGDERDKDVANGIRYAVENGAKVINMSFGKTYPADKKAVDDAVKFAMSKDVLIVHAAGNENSNRDKAIRYPNRNYADNSGSAANWIEVGASSYIDDETLKAPFSCYGKETVDVFAPGVKINSCAPGSGYIAYDGTSMASPVVTGLAVLIRSYYPKLSAAQVKEIIMKSVTPVKHQIKMRDGSKEVKVPFSDLCKSGGIVNAYNALKLAETY